MVDQAGVANVLERVGWLRKMGLLVDQKVVMGKAVVADAMSRGS